MVEFVHTRFVAKHLMFLQQDTTQVLKPLSAIHTEQLICNETVKESPLNDRHALSSSFIAHSRSPALKAPTGTTVLF